MACEVSVIIPSRNEFQNLIWTLQAVQIELASVGHEIIVVLDNCNNVDAHEERLLKYWPAKAGTLKVLRRDENPSCWQSRNYGAREAIGDYLLFIDSHVMPLPGAFRKALEYHRCFEGILHFGVRYWLDNPVLSLCQYRWQPEKFWGAWVGIKPLPPDYRILMAGMNVLVDRAVFEKIGGFHRALGIYGGGEPYIYFKTQMFGFEARCNPELSIVHLTEKRGYSWNNDNLWRNFMIAAYAIDGEDALAPLYTRYQEICKGVDRYLIRLDQLRNEAISLAIEDRFWIEQNAQFTFREVLDSWLEKGKNGLDSSESV